MKVMISKTKWQSGLIAASSLIVLSGCVTGGSSSPQFDRDSVQTTPSAAPAIVPAFRPGPDVNAVASIVAIPKPANVDHEAVQGGPAASARNYFYEDGTLYALRAAVGSSSTIQLQPGETLVNYAAVDEAEWVIDDVAVGEQTRLQVSPTRSDLSTHLVINTDKRSYLVEATSHEGDMSDAAIAWTYPVQPAGQAVAAVDTEDDQREETKTATTDPAESSFLTRWFGGALTVSSANSRGCKLCRDPDDHGDNDHDAGDHDRDHH